MMYSVLLVDDEPWNVFGLKNLINWEELGYSVIGNANSGLQALDMIIALKPDVVFSDIKMPGLNGIELLEEINNRKLKTKVVLVSGYAEFEYAQKAVTLGAVDYLLKQIEKEKLVAVLQALQPVLLDLYKKNDYQQKFSNEFFKLFDGYSKIKLSECFLTKSREPLKPNYVLISSYLPHAVDVLFDEQAICGKEYSYLRISIGKNKLIVGINYDMHQSPEAPYKFISSQLTEAVFIGISGVSDNNTLFSKLYREADVALNSQIFLTASGVREYKAIHGNSNIDSITVMVEQYLRERNFNEALGVINNFFEECKKGKYLVAQVAVLYNQLIALLHKYYPQMSSAEGLEYYTFNQIVYEYGTIDQFFQAISGIFKKNDQSEYHINNDVIKKIMKEIEERFTEDISLQSLSQKYNISIGYLSSLMKKETGQTYKEHIINKRMEMSKNLLKDKNESIDSIAEKVGYMDYFHFTKLFKKYVGISPSKYRKLY